MWDNLQIARREIEDSIKIAEDLMVTVEDESWINPGYLRGKVAAYNYVLGLLDFVEGKRPLQRVGKGSGV